MSSHGHEPREEFVNQLENRLRADLRRQRLEVDTRTWGWGWLPQSRWAAALSLTVVMIMSMAVGGGVVAATYETRLNSQRDMLLGTFEQHMVIARQRLALTKQQLQEIERRVAVGLEPKESVLDLQARVREAEAEVRSIELDIAEINATGREPMRALSAPLVSGRDFVTERWRIEMTVPANALTLEKARAEAARTRFNAGIAKPEDVDEALTRIAELETAVATFERKLTIRQTFLKGGMAGPVADLRGLEAEAELRRTALTRRVESARRRVQALQSRVDVGTANPIEVAEARLHLQELELQATKVDYELLLIRKQLGK